MSTLVDVPNQLTYEIVFASQWFGTVLAPAVPHSPHMRCKIGVFLQLRTASLSRFTIAYLLIPRLNELARHRLPAVQQWANIVITSGWIHQLWPGGPSVESNGVPKSWVARRYKSLLRMDCGGTPRGMRQAYLDSKQLEKSELGWIYGRCADGILYCTLVL